VIKQSESRYAGEHVKNKIYSLHEPRVTCIAKGKRGRPNEYGSRLTLLQEETIQNTRRLLKKE